MPKFSIIMPVYNAQSYLEMSITSILKQTYTDYELIIVDDGSTDQSATVINKFSTYHNIKYYKCDHQGVSATRNYGIKVSTGTYFLFVDADDTIDSDMLMALNKTIIKYKDVDLIKYSYTNITDNHKEVIHQMASDVLNGEEAFKLLVNYRRPFDLICIYLYNKFFWQTHDFKFATGHYHEDFGLIPYMILMSNRLVMMDYSGYNYIQSPESITRTNDLNKTITKAYDYLFHFDHLYHLINESTLSFETKKLANSYLANALIGKAASLKGDVLDQYIDELNRRHVKKLLNDKTIKAKLKKMLININFKFYLQLIGGHHD